MPDCTCASRDLYVEWLCKVRAARRFLVCADTGGNAGHCQTIGGRVVATWRAHAPSHDSPATLLRAGRRPGCAFQDHKGLAI
jgi:hypothetical protein